MILRAETGAYFYNNKWWWAPLADYIAAVDSELPSDGLDAETARSLAAKLRAELASGATAAYAAKTHTPDGPFSVDNVAAFADFLADCGGYRIA